MKRLLFALSMLITLPAVGQGNISFTAGTGGGNIQFSNPNGNPFLLTQSNLQTAVGPLALPYLETYNPVPFQAASAAFFGYNQSGNGSVDLHTGNGGGLDVWTPNILGTGWSNIVHIDNSGTVFPANDVQLTSGNCYYLGGVATEGICDDQFGGVNISTTSSATNGITFKRGGTQQWQMAAAGTFLNASGQTVLPATVTTFQGASAGGPFLVTATTGTGSTGVFSVSPAFTGTPTAPTATLGTNTTQLASTAFVQAAVSGSVAGVASIDTQTGAFTFTGGGVSHVGNAYTFTSSSGVASVAAGPGITVTGTGGGPFTGAVTISTNPIALVTLAIPSGLVAAANSCYGYQSGAWGLRPSNGGTTTAATISMPGILVTPTPALVTSSFQGSADSTIGWGKVGGLTLNLWASAADTASWDVCNPTASQVPATGTAGTPSFTVGARN